MKELVRLAFLLWKKRFLRYLKKDRFSFFLYLFLLMGSFAVFVGSSYFFFSEVTSVYKIEIASELSFKVLLLFSFLYGLINFFSLLTGVADVLLEEEEVAFLAQHPISLEILSWWQILKSYMRTNLWVFLMGYGIWLGWGIVFQKNLFVFTFLFFMVWSLFLGILTVLAYLVVSFLFSFFPPRVLKNWLFFFYVIFLVVLILGMRVLRPEVLFQNDSWKLLLNRLVTWKIPTEIQILPPYWGVDILVKYKFFPNLFFFILIYLFLFFLVKVISRISPLLKAGEHTPSFTLKAPKVTIMVKDWLVFIRDRTQLIQIFIIMGVFLVFAFNVKFISDSMASFIELEKGMIYYWRLEAANFVLAALIITVVASRFILSAFIVEGKKFWIIKSAPIEEKKILGQKYFYGLSWGAGTFLVTIFILFYYFKHDLFFSIFSVFLLTHTLLVVTGGIYVSLLLYRKQKYTHKAGINNILFSFEGVFYLIGMLAWAILYFTLPLLVSAYFLLLVLSNIFFTFVICIFFWKSAILKLKNIEVVL